MSQKEQLIQLLAEYGIHSEAELDEALKNIKINIGVFTTPLQEKSNSSERS